MERRPKVTMFIVLTILFNVLVLTLSSAETNTRIDEVTRSHFPDGFLFGAASAAYQIRQPRLISVMDPLIFGDYPKEMRLFHGNNLPKFTQKETLFLKGSLDFIGINHYTTSYVMDCSHLSAACSYIDANGAAGFLKQTMARDGVPIGGATAASPPFWVVPRGMEEIVDFVKERFNNTPMFITENGYAGKAKETVQDDLNDIDRVDFMKSYLAALALSIRKGADVRGYFAWSLMDSFEWSFGYTLKFGLYHVDFKTQLRTPKLSAKWYSKFMAKKNCQDI